MVHHVALGAESFATFLGALEGAVIVVDTHVHGQIMTIVKRFAALGDWAHVVGS